MVTPEARSGPTCSTCGHALDAIDAITIDGLSFHELCYAMERYGNPWCEDVETLADVRDPSSVVFAAIAARGLEVAGYV
jgi:hypothetical protein